jgi:hypothetical protein
VPHKEYKLLKAALLFCWLCCGRLPATERLPLGQLDPARDIKQPRLESAMHQPLPEQYIWTAGDAAALQKDNARYLFARQKRIIFGPGFQWPRFRERQRFT